MSDKPPTKRRPRHGRHPTKGLHFTDRDYELLSLIGYYRVLTAAQAAALIGVSLDKSGRSQVVERRLLRMYDHGYLQHPKETTDEEFVLGSRQTLHRLTQKGARLVEKRTGVLYPGKALRSSSVRHARMLSECRVAALLSCRKHGVYLTPFEEILERYASEKTKKRALNLKDDVTGWPVEFVHTNNQRLSFKLYPDDIFAVPGKNVPSLLFLEVDTEDEPVTSGNFSRSSIQKKLTLYNETWKLWQNESRTPEPPYGFRHPRALFSVSGAAPRKRIASIQKLGLTLNMSKGLFLFAVHEELVASDFLTHDWQNLKGEPVRLLA